MSVTAQTPYKKYTAAPGATLFSTGFRLILASDLVVKVNGSVVTTGFTVSSLGAAPGSDVTFGTPMTGGEIIELVRSVPKTRLTDYQQLGDYQADAVNNDFDRLVMMVQDSQFLNDLAVLLPVGDTAAPMTLPALADRALKFLAFDALGKAIAAAGVTGSPVSTFMAAVILAADQAAARTALGAQVAGSYAASGTNGDITAMNALASVPNVIAVNAPPSVRQTILAGPVDTNGFAAFGGSTGTTTVTAAGTLKATASNGGSDRTGSITNPSWTGLSTNGTMYLYLDIAASGTCTPGSTTLAPTYRWGGADVVTNGQNTFNQQEMQMKVGNGTTAAQVWRVFVGEVTVSGGVVTAITWYALMGRYVGAWVATLPAASAAVSVNHNIGTVDIDPRLEVQCTTAEFGYAVGDTVTEVNGNTGGVATPISIVRTARTLGFTVTPTGSLLVLNKTTGANATMTLASWRYRLVAQRGW